MSHTLHEGDARKVLPKLESGSVTHVVTDPPYGQSNEWYDSSIAWQTDVWIECFRVCGENAALLYPIT